MNRRFGFRVPRGKSLFSAAFRDLALCSRSGDAILSACLGDCSRTQQFSLRCQIFLPLLFLPLPSRERDQRKEDEDGAPQDGNRRAKLAAWKLTSLFHSATALGIVPSSPYFLLIRKAFEGLFGRLYRFTKQLVPKVVLTSN